MSESNVEEVQSPCIGVCSMNESTGFCHGCYRTIEEIKGWNNMDNTAKAALVKTLADRETAAFD